MTTPLIDHYSVTIRDLNTIIVTAHFIDEEDGYEPQVAAAHMSVSLSRPLSAIDEDFLAGPDNQQYAPCDICEFYAHCDDEMQRSIMIAEGKDPDAEFANWASGDKENDQKERLFFCGNWTPVTKALPAEQEHVLVCNSSSPNAFTAMRYHDEWRATEGGPCPVSPVEFWTHVPQAPIPF